MTPREFFYLVSQMRQAQRDFFRTKEQRALRRSRALENEVDKEIYRVKDILNAQEQNEYRMDPTA